MRDCNISQGLSPVCVTMFLSGEKKKTFVKDHRDGSEWNKQFGHTHDKNRQMSKQEVRLTRILAQVVRL